MCCAVTLSFLHRYFQLVCVECLFGVLCSYPIIFASLFSVGMRGVPVWCVVQLPYHFCIIIFCCYAWSACLVCCVDTLSFLHRFFSVGMRGVPVRCFLQLHYHFCFIIFSWCAWSACLVCCVDTLSFLHRFFFQLLCVECLFCVLCRYPILFASIFCFSCISPISI